MSRVCLAYLDVFYVCLLGEIDQKGPVHVKVYIYIGNFYVRLPKGPPRVPQGGHICFQDTTSAVSIDEAKGWLISPSTERRRGGVYENLS